MIVRGFTVGGETESFCGRCKEMTMHVIIAMVDGKPKRVECLSCHSTHNYVWKRDAGVSAPRGGAKVRKTVSRREPPRQLSAENAVDYRPNGRYEVDMVLRHKQFGLGIVTKVGTRTLEVNFADGPRKLFLTD